MVYKISKTLKKGPKTSITKSKKDKSKISKPKNVLPPVEDSDTPNQQIKVVQHRKKYMMPSKSVTDELVMKCLQVLQQLSNVTKKKNAIFDDENPIFAEIRCIKIPNAKGNIKFVLPHCTIASTGEICLITPDLKKGRRPDHEPTIDHWEDILKKAGVENVKTIMPMRQLRVEYDQYELKRRLLTQHDYIMVDTKILNHVSHLLGKMFFKKHNMLIPVRINEKGDIKKDIDIGVRTAMLRLNEGQTSTIQVGHTGMSQDDVKENVLSLITQLKSRYPGGETNVRSISLKLPLSLSLPIYLTLRPSTGDIPKVIHKKPKHFEELEDEISTRPGSRVTVAPDGTVHLKRNSESDMETDDEEDIDEDNTEQD